MPTATVFVELGAILLALALVARVAERLGLSPIPLYLLVGLSIGEGGVYPVVTAEDFIEVGAEIGVVLLLLMLGLEYSPAELVAGLRSSLPVAIVDLAANFAPGLLAAVLLGWGWLAAALLGGVTYVSSSGIVAKLVSDLGWLANRETPSVFSLLVAEDLVMALYLPLVGALLIGGSIGAAGASLTLALTGAGLTLLLALRWGELVSRLVLAPSNEALLLGVLGLTLLVAGLAEQLHVSAAVGAFLVGIAFSGPVQEIARGLLRPLRDLFAAIFFAFVGLSVDPASIPPVLLPAAVLAVVTLVSKALTGWIAAAQAGVGVRGATRAALLLTARGEFSIAIAGFATAAGVAADFEALAVAYVFLLAIAGPVLVRFADAFSAPLVRRSR